MQHIFIFLSSAFASISPIVYAKAILDGKAKPHRTTRLLILVISIIAAIALFAQHSNVTIWLAVISVLQALLIFALSLKRGMGGWAKLDIFCLFIALFGILLWKTTSNPALALFAAIGADFIGSVPSIVKTYRFPKTEIWTFYAINILGDICILLAVTSWTIQEVIYPFYFLFINGCMLFLVLRENIILGGRKHIDK